MILPSDPTPAVVNRHRYHCFSRLLDSAPVLSTLLAGELVPNLLVRNQIELWLQQATTAHTGQSIAPVDSVQAGDIV